MASKKFDGVIEAVHFKDGQIAYVRAFERRGFAFTDRIILNRNQLLERLKSANDYYRRELLGGASTPDPRSGCPHDGRELIATCTGATRDGSKAFPSSDPFRRARGASMKIIDKTQFQNEQADFSARAGHAHGPTWYPSPWYQGRGLFHRLLEKGFVLIPTSISWQRHHRPSPGRPQRLVCHPVTHLKGFYQAQGDQWNHVDQGRPSRCQPSQPCRPPRLPPGLPIARRSACLLPSSLSDRRGPWP
jgi:hypothetical protein